MRVLLRAQVFVAIAVAMTGIPSRISAVDLINRDKQERTVAVVTPEGRTIVKVPAGGTLANVCGMCINEVPGGPKRDASGAQKVTLNGPMLLVSGQP
jgi:hypothetical protein